MISRQSAQSGSAIIIILVAVALFGALTYTMMRGSDSSVSMFTSSNAKATASAMITYGNEIERAVQKLLRRGCSENQINFYNTIWQNGNGTLLIPNNPNSPVDGSCGVFDAAGAGMTPQTFESNMTTTTNPNPAISGKSGHPFIRVLRIAGVGTDSGQEIILVVNYIKEPLCKAINDLALGTPTVSTTPDSKAGWNGAYHLTTATGILGDEDTSLVGKRTFCFNNANDDSYTFVYAVYER